MPNYAKLTLMGHVGQDPRTPSDRNPEFITFSFAVTEKWKDRNTGERKEKTDWYECLTSQTSLSSVVKNYVKKGNPLYIEGTPKYSTYQTKDGQTRVKVEVNINRLVLLGDKQDNQQTTQAVSNVTTAASHTDDPFSSDEIPF